MPVDASDEIPTAWSLVCHAPAVPLTSEAISDGRQRGAPDGVLGGRPVGRYRGDIDGLRAVAVTLVVLFHAGVPALSGGYVGVDVFFVLSGFLITGLLLRELHLTGTISLTGFYARRIRRLLPLSALVLAATAVASHLLTSTLDRPGVGADIRATALYMVNWHYAAEATQYMADTDKSPVLHYWSLSVEEQFYVVWPLLILLVAGVTGLARRRFDVARRRVVWALAAVGAVSLTLSAATSVSSGPWAYFGLHTRAWELAAGAGLALLTPAITLRSRLAAALLGWAGVLVIVASALTLDADTVFPGTAALFPVLGAVMVVAAGGMDDTAGPSRLLANPVLRYVGRLSYAWYLWHWPCLVLFGGLNHSGAAGEDLQPQTDPLWPRVAAVAVSFLLAVVSHHLVENPARRSTWLSRSRGRTLRFGAVLTVACLALALVPAASLFGREPTAVAGVSVETAQAARSDTADVPKGCYQGLDTTATPSDCLFGDPAGTRSIVLAGDSNARFWFPAFDTMARTRGWKLYFWGKSGCPLVDGTLWLGKNRSAYTTCTTWRRNVTAQLTRLGSVDAVVLARSRATYQYVMVDEHSRATASQLEPTWREAATRTVRSLAAVTPHVVLLTPVPRPATDVPACVAEDPATAGTRCAFPRGPATGPGPLERAEAAVAGAERGVSVVDLNRSICPTDPCPAVSADGRIIYLNQNHLTAGYAESLWPVLATSMDRQLG